MATLLIGHLEPAKLPLRASPSPPWRRKPPLTNLGAAPLAATSGPLGSAGRDPVTESRHPLFCPFLCNDSQRLDTLGYV